MTNGLASVRTDSDSWQGEASIKPVQHVLPVLATLGVFALLAFTCRGFVTDDSLITLRYARHLASGHGIVWNVGEDPVEGYTNFSHVEVGAIALRLGLPALSVLRALNVLGGAVTCLAF